MEHQNKEQPERVGQTGMSEERDQTLQEKAEAPKGSVESASDRLLSFSENATVEEKIILEQIAGTKRDPRITKIGKKNSALEGILLILLSGCLIAFGLIFYVGALPLLSGGAIVLILMGSWRLINRKKRPSVCPFCSYFDEIQDGVEDYQCPRCGSESNRVGDELHPKKAEAGN